VPARGCGLRRPRPDSRPYGASQLSTAVLRLAYDPRHGITSYREGGQSRAEGALLLISPSLPVPVYDERRPSDQPMPMVQGSMWGGVLCLASIWVYGSPRARQKTWNTAFSFGGIFFFRTVPKIHMLGMGRRVCVCVKLAVRHTIENGKRRQNCRRHVEWVKKPPDRKRKQSSVASLDLGVPAPPGTLPIKEAPPRREAYATTSPRASPRATA
jgi:hypothetical protein